MMDSGILAISHRKDMTSNQGADVNHSFRGALALFLNLS